MVACLLLRSSCFLILQVNQHYHHLLFANSGLFLISLGTVQNRLKTMNAADVASMIVTSTRFLLSPMKISFLKINRTSFRSDPYELRVAFDVTQYARFVAKKIKTR